MKPLARWVFRLLATIILRRHHPVVVAVAGSVGKTATKDALAAALNSAERPARGTVGNFNAEIGVPATVMSAGGSPTSLGGWVRLVFRGLRQALLGRTYPALLVLELAADHPGDLRPLLKMIQPTVGVLTSAAPEHLEFFGDEAGVIAEESLVVRQLPSTGTAVVNIDDPRIAALLPSLTTKVITYGWSHEAQVRADSMSMTKNAHGMPDGMVVKVAIDGSTVPVAIPGVIGRHQVYPILAAIAVGVAVGDEVMSIVQRLSSYVPPPGRMRLFAGREGSLLIDDTYNASPEAVQAALQSLHELEGPSQRIAILGQMSELGAAAAEWHDRIGREVAQLRISELVLVGPLAERIGRAAIAAGFSATNVHMVATAEAAAATILPRLNPSMAVLLKGSRFASRLERAVAILLDNPDRDTTFLVHGH